MWRLRRRPYRYPRAGRGAARLVQQAIRLFHARVPKRVKRNTPLLYWLIGPDGTQPYKMAPNDADYGPPPPTLVGRQCCGNCIEAYQNAVGGYYVCALIQGNIQPPMWCRLWRGQEG